MKVLVSAYACEPGRGAEPGVGWNIVKGLSAKHELWVLTRSDNEEVIAGSGEEWVARVNWVYLDPPRWLTFWKRGRRGLMLFYFLWQWTALFRAKALMEEQDEGFDLVHHLTFGSVVPASPLALLGRPMVYGPLGGAENPPEELEQSMPWRLRWKVWRRRLIHGVAFVVSRAGHVYRDSAWVLAATPQAAQFFREVGAKGVSVLPQSGIGDDEVTRFGERNRLAGRAGPIRLVCASRLIYWKGVDLAIEGVARAVESGVDVELDILEMGPEREALEELVAKNGLEERVRFRGRLESLEEVYALIGKADALVHLAIHEAFGQACLESMALGVPVICLDWAGPGMLVSEESGYPIPVGSREEVLDGVADAILRCGGERGQGEGKSEKARERARLFLWEGVVKGVLESYKVVND
ncbi:MAG: glycosyltransferase family 4 protein [Verrucomicrobiaceae bacterium]